MLEDGDWMEIEEEGKLSAGYWSWALIIIYFVYLLDRRTCSMQQNCVTEHQKLCKLCPVNAQACQPNPPMMQFYFFETVAQARDFKFLPPNS